MPLQNDAPLDDLAKVIRAILELRRSAAPSDSVERWCRHLLYQALRAAEEFIEPEFSVAALAEAARHPDCDLQTRHRRDWLGPMEVAADDFVGKRRRAFQWEHVRPLGMAAKALRELSPPFETAAIKAELERLEIAWVTRAEDHRLNRNQLKAHRPGELWDAYKKLCIAIKGKESQTRQCGETEQCSKCPWASGG